MENWDPLYISPEQTDILTHSQKRVIQNILKSYVGFYDPFSELLQNALDAVDARSREEEDGSGYKKEIYVFIDLQNNSLSVTDNGIGFNESQFKSFLSPNVSFKDGDLLRGHKGVGSTYIAYGYNYLQLGTKSSDYEDICELVNGRRWVEDRDGKHTKPLVKSSENIHHVFDRLDRGSTFTIKFIGENIRPKSLLWNGARDAEQWANILLLKTPLGEIINNEEDKSDVQAIIEVRDTTGDETKIVVEGCKYIYPHTKINASVSVDEIMKYQQKLLDQGRDPAKMPAKFSRLNGVYKYWNTEELVELIKRSWGEEFEDILNHYSISAYGYFAYSTKVWDTLNDDVLRLRRGMRIVQGGLQLATNQMAQGDLYRIPLTSNIGYQNQAHIVVHFEGAEPDLGRKGFQPELRDLAERLSVSAVSVLSRRRQNLQDDTGVAPNIESMRRLHDWVHDQEEHEKGNPILINSDKYFLPKKELSITSIPQKEQDVVVLFNQLLAGGVIRGVKMMTTSTHKQYDGLFRFTNEGDDSIYAYHEEDNPLGVDKQALIKKHTSVPLVLEYKYNVDALISDFDNEEKQENDIRLIVAWDIGSEWEKRYDVDSYLDGESFHNRPYHGLSHEFKDQNSGSVKFYGLILSELVSYLNDQPGTEREQKLKYSTE